MKFADAPCNPPAELLVIDVLDEDLGLADVEDDQGRTFQLPVAWLSHGAAGGAQEGQAYRITLRDGGVFLTHDPEAGRLFRERSKQTLLDFSDHPQEKEAEDSQDRP